MSDWFGSYIPLLSSKSLSESEWCVYDFVLSLCCLLFEIAKCAGYLAIEFLCWSSWGRIKLLVTSDCGRTFGVIRMREIIVPWITLRMLGMVHLTSWSLQTHKQSVESHFFSRKLLPIIPVNDMISSRWKCFEPISSRWKCFEPRLGLTWL